MKPAFATEEVGLRPAVAPVDKTADATSLARMPGVDSDDLAAESLSLVLKEALELGKAPGVETTLGFPVTSLDLVANIGKVLNHDSGAGFNAVENRGRENVVAIPSESLLTISKASKVPFGGLRTIGLQSTSEAKDTLNNFLHMPVAVEPVVRGHGWPGNSQVNPDSSLVTNKLNIGQIDYNVKVEPPFAVDEVGGSCRTADCISGIHWQGKRYFDSTASAGKVDDALAPVQMKGMQIIAGWADNRLWALSFTPFLQFGNCRPHCFTGLLSSLDMKIGGKGWLGILALAISQAMKSVGITCALLPTSTADGIKRLSELLNRLFKSFSLFRGGLKLYLDRSIHVFIIHIYLSICKLNLREEVCRNSSAT